jgi:CheY-like chemotaxis protein
MNRVQRWSSLTPRVWLRASLSRLASAFKAEHAFVLSRCSHPTADPVSSAIAPRVLVVDDDPDSRLLASSLLARYGITPLLAADGAEAVALACGNDLDLILMDLQMPVLGGLAATKQIRRFELEHCRERAPVVAYTSSSLGDDEPLLLKWGLDAALGKPCDEESLKTCLFRWCPQETCNTRLPQGAIQVT